MGIKKCKECGGDVSTDADTCPHCGKKQPEGMSLLGLLVAVVVLYAIYSGVMKSSEQSSAEAFKKSQIEKIESAKRASWPSKREGILAEIRKRASAGNHAGAYSLAREHAYAKDKEVDDLARTERIAQLKQELKTIPASKSFDNMSRYEELSRYEPGNKTYREKYEKYKKAYDAKVKRKKLIEQQFSSWDGSHVALERYVKKNLKDPDSYEHIETRYSDAGGDTIKVLMRYRARNSFGGMVIGNVVGTVTIDGKLLSVSSL